MADAFHLNGGGSFSDLDGFERALRDMDPAVFAFHTNDRNDFSTWVQDGMRKPLLAALLRECENAHEMLIAIETYALVSRTPEEEPLVSEVVRRVTSRFS